MILLHRNILFRLCDNDYWTIPYSIVQSVNWVLPGNSHRVAGMIAFALYRWVNDTNI